MRRSMGQRIDLVTRYSMPALFAMLLVLINMIPLHIPGIARIMPVLPMIAVYHLGGLPAGAAAAGGRLRDRPAA